VRFIYFLIFALLILAVRAYLKKIKYEGKNMVTTLSDRSVMLTNVHPEATAQDIKERFSDWDIEKVVFTYRVREYFKKLVGIYDIKKEKILATKQG
jgi:S-adenosylmethionine synthetase